MLIVEGNASFLKTFKCYVIRILKICSANLGFSHLIILCFIPPGADATGKTLAEG